MLNEGHSARVFGNRHTIWPDSRFCGSLVSLQCSEGPSDRAHGPATNRSRNRSKGSHSGYSGSGEISGGRRKLNSMSWLTWFYGLMFQSKNDERLVAACAAVDELKEETAIAVAAFRRVAKR